MDREVINMENIGVTCDVCECCHNVSGCKCDLPQIKVTEPVSYTHLRAHETCTLARLSSMNTHSLAFRPYLSSRA